MATVMVNVKLLPGGGKLQIGNFSLTHIVNQ